MQLKVFISITKSQDFHHFMYSIEQYLVCRTRVDVVCWQDDLILLYLLIQRADPLSFYFHLKLVSIV